MAALSEQVLGHVVDDVPQVGQVGSDIRRRACSARSAGHRHPDLSRYSGLACLDELNRAKLEHGRNATPRL